MNMERKLGEIVEPFDQKEGPDLGKRQAKTYRVQTRLTSPAKELLSNIGRFKKEVYQIDTCAVPSGDLRWIFVSGAVQRRHHALRRSRFTSTGTAHQQRCRHDGRRSVSAAWYCRPDMRISRIITLADDRENSLYPKAENFNERKLISFFCSSS